MTRRSRRASRSEAIVERSISPVAAKVGSPVKVAAKARCSCKTAAGVHGLGDEPDLHLNPNCPVHGHGRPAGRV